MGSHLKNNGTHLLRNAGNHLINECDGGGGGYECSNCASPGPNPLPITVALVADDGCGNATDLNASHDLVQDGVSTCIWTLATGICGITFTATIGPGAVSGVRWELRAQNAGATQEAIWLGADKSDPMDCSATEALGAVSVTGGGSGVDWSAATMTVN